MFFLLLLDSLALLCCTPSQPLFAKKNINNNKLQMFSTCKKKCYHTTWINFIFDIIIIIKMKIEYYSGEYVVQSLYQVIF